MTVSGQKLDVDLSSKKGNIPRHSTPQRGANERLPPLTGGAQEVLESSRDSAGSERIHHSPSSSESPQRTLGSTPAKSSPQSRTGSPLTFVKQRTEELSPKITLRTESHDETSGPKSSPVTMTSSVGEQQLSKKENFFYKHQEHSSSNDQRSISRPALVAPATSSKHGQTIFQQKIGKTVHQIMEEALELVHNGVSLPQTEDRMLNEHDISDIPSHSKTSSDTRIPNRPTNPRTMTFVKDGTELETPSTSIRMAQLVGSVTNKAAALERADRATSEPPSSQLNLKQKDPSLSSSKLPEGLKTQGCPIATLESVAT